MVRKYVITGILVICTAILAGQAHGLNLEYKEYAVKKGDTLWDISAEELKDPFLWPNIWKENPDIENPDLIYPDQVIKIPVYLLQKQVRLAPPPPPEITPPTEVALPTEASLPEKEPEPRPAPEEEKPAEYLVSRNFVMVSGFITPELPTVGTFKGTPTMRSILGEGDEAYVNINGDTSPGKRFYTFRYIPGITHPDGEKLGFLIEITGIAKIVGEEAGSTKIVLTDSFQEVTLDDYLMDYFEIEPPLKTDEPRRPDIHGLVVTTRELRKLNATGDVVYIDRGDDHGVQKGDVFIIVSGEYPRIPIGRMVIILTRERTATALITRSERIVERGDTF